MSFSGFSLSEILDWTQGKWVNESLFKKNPSESCVQAMADLSVSKPGEVSFFFSKKYQQELMNARPTVLMTGEAFVGPLLASGWPGLRECALVACQDPYLSMAILSEKFSAVCSTVGHFQKKETTIHPTAILGKGVQIGEGAQVGAYVVLEDRVIVGAGSVIYPYSYVGVGSSVGQDCVLFPRVTLYENVRLGDRVRIHSGAVLGADGFGYAPQVEQGKFIQHRKIYHLGGVLVGNDVEIGANTCIDRGTMKDTSIGSMSKIDDHVMIGHNCQIGKAVIICGSVSMAGSVEVQEGVTIGGMSGLPNGIVIGARAKLAGGTFVSADVASGETVAGHPHRKFKDFFRLQVHFNRMLDKKGNKRHE